MTRFSGVRPRLAVFCSGYGSNFQAVLDAIRRGSLRAEVAVMVCDRPGAFAIRRAHQSGVPVCVLSPKLFPDRPAYERMLLAVLSSQQIDLVVLAGFMRILTPVFIRAYRGRIVNIHPSLLPKHKGAHAIEDAFRAGDKVTGVTVHLVTPKVDDGPVLAQKSVRILDSDTLESLEKKIHAVEHRLYPKAIQAFLKQLLKKH